MAAVADDLAVLESDLDDLALNGIDAAASPERVRAWAPPVACRR